MIQTNDYYPFGLTFNEYIRTGSTVQKYKFGGKEEQEDWGIGVMDFEARFYDGVLGRFMNIDPLADERNWLTPYNHVQNNPLMRVDPTGMLDDYVFDENGIFTGEIRETGSDTHQIVVQEEDGSETTYSLNDPEKDSKTLEALTTYHPDAQLVFLKTEQDVQNYMENAGISEKSFFSRLSYAWDESRTGSMDFPEVLRQELRHNSVMDPSFVNNDDSGFFIFGQDNEAYNTADAGNYLWGNAMKRLGFGLQFSKDAAHIHNAFFDPNPGLSDAPADQRAIANGHGGNTYRPPAKKSFPNTVPRIR